MPIRQFRSPVLSKFQTAVDHVLWRSKRLRDREAVMPETITAQELCAPLDQGQAWHPDGLLAVGELFAAQAAASYEFGLAIRRGDKAATEKIRNYHLFFEDPFWAEVALEFGRLLTAAETVPYRRQTSLDDFVMDGLARRAHVVLVSDWGTGEPEARELMRRILEKRPDVLIHLGDIYYSGTREEIDRCFLAPIGFRRGSCSPRVFALAGNHDLYAGGDGYYYLLDTLGQPASYFCLRNDYWQFLALDTGLHDADPVGKQSTFLEDSEQTWLIDKVRRSGQRGTVLLSHHQLFSAFETVGSTVNPNLRDQLSPVLDSVSAWFWGHEHRRSIYAEAVGLRLGRCIGNGGVREEGCDEHPAVPLVSGAPVQGVDAGGFRKLGYADLELDGPSASVSYYEFDPYLREEAIVYSETMSRSRGPAASVGRPRLELAGPAQFTVTAPQFVLPGSEFLVLVWAHLEDQFDAVVSRASKELGVSEALIRTKGPVLLERGSSLSVTVKIEGCAVDDPEDTLLWEGSIANASFLVRVPPVAAAGPHSGVVSVACMGMRIARMYFQITVTQTTGGHEILPSPAHRLRKAFASYASQDRDEVLGRIQGIQKVAPELEVFLDVDSLRSGHYWTEEILKIIPATDVFYLFWSVHASRSAWVEKEWRCALDCKGIDFIDPVPLAPPEEAPPPPELSQKHFNDWILAYRRRKPECS